MATVTKRADRGRIEGLDLLRGIAVGLVILQHAIPAGKLYSGLVGVVVFFTLSGYLITGLLIADLVRYDKVRYRRFYAHRTLRLLPALVLMLVCYVLFQTFSSWGTDPRPVIAALIGLTYTADLPHLSAMTHSIGHLWTLAVEEQFYLVWPALLLVAHRWARLDVLIVAALVVTELVAAAGPAAGASFYSLYYYPTSWAFALVLGAAAKVYEVRLKSVLTGGRAHLALLLVAMVVLMFWCVPFLPENTITYPVEVPMVAASAVVLIFRLRQMLAVKGLLRPLLGLGVLSYAAYLWNLPISGVTLDRGLPAVLAGVLSVVLTVVAAAASWYLIERPVRDWRFRRAQRVGDATEPTGAAVLPTYRLARPGR